MQQGVPAIDLAAVLERIGGDEDLLKELAGLYLDDEEQLLNAIGQALTAGDSDGLRRAAHSLKGAVSNFCAPRAQSAAQALEASGRDGRLEDAATLHQALLDALQPVRAALTSLRG